MDQTKTTMQEPELKRNVAFKLRIGDVLSSKPVIENEKLRFIEINNKNIVRVNLVANVIEKFVQEGEKKFGSITLDDASGQIKLKVFGDDIKKLEAHNQGDTLNIIGLVRSWKGELYLTPEIIKKKEPTYLIVRKLECDALKPKVVDKEVLTQLKDNIIQIVKRDEEKGGSDIDNIIMELKSPPESINQEIRKLLEEGTIYEPRPGKVRYLG